MKYQAEDGEVFATEAECREHEAKAIESAMERKVEAYVDSFAIDDVEDRMGEPMFTGRARTRKIQEIMRWIRYDIKMNPERYLFS